MDFMIDLVVGLLSFIFNIAKVIIPLMIVMEILKDLKIMDKIAEFIKPVTDFFTIHEKSGISVVVGVIFGLLFGAGVIIKNTKDENIDKRSVFLICMFLSLCHAVIEDTLVFGTIGASLLPIIGARFFSAVFITFIFSRMIPVKNI